MPGRSASLLALLLVAVGCGAEKDTSESAPADSAIDTTVTSDSGAADTAVVLDSAVVETTAADTTIAEAAPDSGVGEADTSDTAPIDVGVDATPDALDADSLVPDAAPDVIDATPDVATPTCKAESDCPADQICTAAGCSLPASCKELLAHKPSKATGLHTLAGDATGVSPPFKVYCDMTTAGGGWTRIAHLQAADRDIASVYRGARFFAAAWTQGVSKFSLYPDNSAVVLDGANPGMLDARAFFKTGVELRFTCLDLTRSLRADAYRALTELEVTEWLSTLDYAPAGRSWTMSKNGAPFAALTAYATAANNGYWGNWHICGGSGPGTGGFQLGLCGTPPTVADTSATNLNQIAIGYHAGYAGLRLECTADTPYPSTLPISNGYLLAWVR